MLFRIQKIKVSCKIALALSIGLIPFQARAQVNSNIVNVALAAQVQQSISVSAGLGTVNFTLLAGGVADGDNPVPITTSWNLNPGVVGAVTLYAYFDVPAQALTDGTNNIPSANVLGRYTAGTPTVFTSITQSNPVGPAGGSLLLFTETITGANKVKTRGPENLDLRVDLTSLPNQAASTYNGTLRIQAQAL